MRRQQSQSESTLLQYSQGCAVADCVSLVAAAQACCSSHQHKHEPHHDDCACHQHSTSANVDRRQLLWAAAAGLGLAAQTNPEPASAAGTTQYSAEGIIITRNTHVPARVLGVCHKCCFARLACRLACRKYPLRQMSDACTAALARFCTGVICLAALILLSLPAAKEASRSSQTLANNICDESDPFSASVRFRHWDQLQLGLEAVD